jgi:E3 ubiquitin-protein ligase HERC3
VSFKGESYRSGKAAQGPGVTREFFLVALRSFLAAVFIPTGKRTYWFSDVCRPDAYFACGVLLGQVLLHSEFIPNVFPWPLFDLLLRDLGSPRASAELTLQHLAAVSQAEADSLSKVQEHEGMDITEIFGDLGWERIPQLEGKTLTQDTKSEFVKAYVHWSLEEKIKDRFGPFSRGFRCMVGSSVMMQKMVDAKQLERIMCGAEIPVDIAAIRRRALHQNWDAEDQEYLDQFWSTLAEFPEAAKLQFVIFVTGSDRVPLQGWEDLRVKIQKNGGADERLPSAYTCFSLVLLPRYSSVDVLRRNVLQAIVDSQGFGLQ